MDTPGTQPRWWHGATLYQIYVRSWQDTNDDGYGDLNGVTAHLDYLSWLGVDGIWLSPTMPSPDEDWGYDVSDYMGVHPELGTLADLDRLIAEAGQRDLRVLLDLVPNHTSSAHPWFVEAVSDPRSPHREFYVWADPAPDGGPPNNWLAATGAPAWTLDEASGQYYLHNFLPSQPDLNWWNLSVHQAFQDILRFWFDRGVAGFRIDVAQGLYKDAQLRDDPPAPEGEVVRGRFGLAQVYSANRPESHGVFRDWRKIAESYPVPRVLLGETWVGNLDALAAFHGQGDELQLTFNFPFIFSPFTADALSAVVGETLEKLPAGGVRGLDRVQSRHQPVPHPLVRRRRAPHPAGPAGAGHPARHARPVLRRRAGHDRRGRPGRAGPRQDEGGSRSPGEPGPGPDPDALGLLPVWGVHRRPASSPGCRTGVPRADPLRRCKRSHRPSCTCAATCWRCGAENSPACWPATSSGRRPAGCGPTRPATWRWQPTSATSRPPWTARRARCCSAPARARWTGWCCSPGPG